MTAVVEWPARGLCADDPDAWLTVRPSRSGRPHSTDRAAVQEAVQACHRCPGLDACIRYTLTQPELPRECVQAGKIWPALLRDRQAVAAELGGSNAPRPAVKHAKLAKTLGPQVRICLHCGDPCYPRRDLNRPGPPNPAGAKRYVAKGLCQQCYDEGRIPLAGGRGRSTTLGWRAL